MFSFLLFKFSVFYMILFLSVLCHTVVRASDVSVPQKELNSKVLIEQIKNNGGDEGNVQSKNQSESGTSLVEKPVSTETLHNITNHNSSVANSDPFFNSNALPKWMLNIKDGALQRTGYVALGFMSIVLIFFVIRAVRLRQRRSKSRKYGIITSNVSDMEMEPLDRDDDEEEDTTIYDAQHKYSLQ